MSLEQFMNDAISPWMRESGPENDIVLSTRIRLARNFQDEIFPIIAEEKDLTRISDFFKQNYEHMTFRQYESLELIEMSDLSYIEKRVLVEKHLISPYLADRKSTRLNSSHVAISYAVFCLKK